MMFCTGSYDTIWGPSNQEELAMTKAEVPRGLRREDTDLTSLTKEIGEYWQKRGTYEIYIIDYNVVKNLPNLQLVQNPMSLRLKKHKLGVSSTKPTVPCTAYQIQKTFYLSEKQIFSNKFKTNYFHLVSYNWTKQYIVVVELDRFLYL